MRSIRFSIPLIAAALGLMVASSASAQDSRWSFDLLAGAAFPTSEVEGEDLGTGFGFEGAFTVRLQNHIHAYAGWDWHRFAPDASFAGPEVDFEETGYVFGLSFEHPFSGETGGGAAYRLRAGATLNHIELEDSDGELIADSGHGAGWEVGAGLILPVGGGWRLAPMARFRSTERDVEFGGATVPIGLDYLTLDIGFSRRF